MVEHILSVWMIVQITFFQYGIGIGQFRHYSIKSFIETYFCNVLLQGSPSDRVQVFFRNSCIRRVSSSGGWAHHNLWQGRDGRYVILQSTEVCQLKKCSGWTGGCCSSRSSIIDPQIGLETPFCLPGFWFKSND